jgi:hypothetical protein
MVAVLEREPPDEYCSSIARKAYFRLRSRVLADADNWSLTWVTYPFAVSLLDMKKIAAKNPVTSE